ncbi:MAG: tyrosine-type recombinase/integrase [Beijerinckiaceae bacterium]|nr:tyrosine-type recombinase/integrase [Beijerinckiaceae bacterium]MCZ8301813.1 tyrosine-type recombinase/integrase [Beijerinckiaceae bacterium]
MPLTDVAIRGSKSNGKLQKKSDGGGLQLWVMPQGSKLWRFAYRYNGSQKSLAIGPYPEISLAEARQKRDDAKRLLINGIDPSQKKKLDKIAKSISDSATFEVVAEEYLAKKVREGLAESTQKRLRTQLRYVLPALGKRPLTEITAPEVLEPLKRIEARGTFETATRTKELCGAVFRYGQATGRCKDDPTQALKGALTSHQVKHRAAITDPMKLAGFLRDVDEFEGQITTRIAMKLLMLVFTRPVELRNALWEEFDFKEAVWKVTAGRMKMRRPHAVPLSRQAIALLQELQDITGHAKLLFPGNRSITRPISANTLNAAMRRMGFTKEEICSHGFRGTASTLLNESGRFQRDAIDRALSHKDPNEVRRAYNHSAYWQERVEMAQWWADYLDGLRKGDAVELRMPAAT